MEFSAKYLRTVVGATDEPFRHTGLDYWVMRVEIQGDRRTWYFGSQKHIPQRILRGMLSGLKSTETIFLIPWD